MPEPMDHMTTRPLDRTRWRRTAALALAVMPLVPLSLTACSTSPQPGATPTLTTVTVTQTTAQPPPSTSASTSAPTSASTPTANPFPAPAPAPTRESDATVIPRALEGTWQSLDQGSAEVLYTFSPDGRFVRAQVLMQSRTSGTFEFDIGTKGVVDVAGPTLTLTPESGVQTLHDPDSPSSSYDGRPLEDLSPETYTWSMQGDTLVLVGEFGTVAYEPVTQEPPR